MNKTRYICQAQLNELEHSGMSEQQIADKFKLSRMGLYKFRKRMNWPQVVRSDNGVRRLARTDEEERLLHVKYSADFRDRQRACGKVANPYNNRLRVLIFRAILGRDPKRNEVIHHIDRNPYNNTPGNLIICDNNYHRSVFHNANMENFVKHIVVPSFTVDEYKAWRIELRARAKQNGFYLLAPKLAA